MTDFTPKWHRELEIFSRIKPLIMLEGNVFDSYQFTYEGSVPQGSILRLTDYLHYFFRDKGYANIAFYDSLRGFYNSCEEGLHSAFCKSRGSFGAERRGSRFVQGRQRRRSGAAHPARSLTEQRILCSYNDLCFPVHSLAGQAPAV